MMLFLAFFGFAWAAYTEGQYLVPPANLEAPPYAEWAHYHWVWLSHTEVNQTKAIDYVKEYQNHGIRVGATDIDSDWSTCCNNFEFDPKKYPEPQSLINDLHSLGVRVILWATSMIDEDCDSIFHHADTNGFFVRNMFNKRSKTIKWWHGRGSLVDYTNPKALDWWHQQLDKVLSLGIDGWKVDGTDPYIMELVLPRGYGGHYVDYREYADAYYRDFFYYTRKKLGNDRLIMSRPVDSLDNIVYLKFSPRDVVFSGWVGDQDPTFDGLKDALKNMLHSARANYVGFGSDIGGYRGGKGQQPLGRSKELLIRWAQMGAFSPLMENGGDNEHRPWKFDGPQDKNTTTSTLAIYKKFVDIHYSLVAFFLSEGTRAFADGTSILKAPVSDEEYSYILGEAIFVAPFVENGASREILFPDGALWMDWWNSSRLFKGGRRYSYSCSLEDFPVFKKVGSIIPFNFGEPKEPGEPGMGIDFEFISAPTDAERSYNVRDYEGGISIASRPLGGMKVAITISATQRPVRITVIDSQLVGKSLSVSPQLTASMEVDQTLGSAKTRIFIDSCSLGCILTFEFDTYT